MIRDTDFIDMTNNEEPYIKTSLFTDLIMALIIFMCIVIITSKCNDQKDFII